MLLAAEVVHLLLPDLAGALGLDALLAEDHLSCYFMCFLFTLYVVLSIAYFFIIFSSFVTSCVACSY